MTRFLFAALVCLMSVQSLFAVGALYARRALSNDQGVPLWLEKYDATVKITDQMAVTHVDQTFKNETYQRLEGIFIFPLPKNAVVTEVALWINGVRVLGEAMEKDTARMIYQSIVQPQRDPALVEYVGANVFKLSVFPIEPLGNAMCERRIEITYAELLPYEKGNVDYTFFMKTINMSAKPVLRASVTLALTAQQDILSFVCVSHPSSPAVTIQKISSRSYTAVFGAENACSDRDLEFTYRLKIDNFALNHLGYIPNTKTPMFFDVAGDIPYFLLWVTPPDSVTQQTIIKKNVVFVADVSSSMAGTRIEQLKNSLNMMVDMLNPIDDFNIMPFSTGVSQFRTDLVNATPSVKTQAHDYINRLAEGGLTDMEDALKLALKSRWNDTCVNAAIFLTDGKPSWPTASTTTSVIDTATRYNAGHASIYTFGIGADVDSVFLKRLAAENSGMYRTIITGDSIRPVMAAFMEKISYPLIKNISMNYGTLSTSDIYPSVLPDLYAGSQLTVLGRFRAPQTSMVTFKGSQGRRDIIISQSINFGDTSANHPFVPRMWASAKIDYLLNQIALYGQQQELVDNVKQLGKKYGIITPYTSILVTEPGVNTGTIEDKTLAAPDRMRLTSEESSSGIILRYAIPRMKIPQIAVLKIFDARGKLMRVLVNEPSLGGNFSVAWDRMTDMHGTVPAGVYVAILHVGQMQAMTRIQLMR